MDNNFIKIFSSEIYLKNDIHQETMSKITELLNEQKKLKANNEISNVGGFQTVPLPMEECVENLIRTHITNYIKNYKMSKQIKTVEVVCNYFWINENNYSNFNVLHSHLGNSIDLTGVYYIKHPKDSGKLGFYDTSHEGTCLSNIFEGFDCYNWLDVKKGDFLIFPSSYRHCVEPNWSKDNRISISFNISLVYN